MCTNLRKATKRREQLRRVRSCPPQPFDLVLQAVCSQQGDSEHEVLRDAHRFLELMRQQDRPVDINAITASGMTALTQCVLDGSLKSVKTLVALGVDVNKKDRRGWTALHYAASEGYIEIVRFLLKCDGNVRTMNREGELPMDLAEDDGIRKLLTRVTLFYTPTRLPLRRRCSLPNWASDLRAACP